MGGFFKRNRNKILGGIAGLLVALLLILAWPFFLILFFIFMGVLLGGLLDAGRRIGNFIEELFPRKKKDDEVS